MSASKEMRALADLIDAAVGERDLGRAIRLAEDALRLASGNTVQSLREGSFWTSLPRNQCLALYLGYSEGLGRYKVGITSNPQRRIREINSTLRHLAFAPDFDIVHFGFAPEHITRAAERHLLYQYRRFSVGGEWFREKEEVFLGIFEHCEQLWGDYDDFLTAFSIEPDLTSLRPSGALYGPTTKQQEGHLIRLTQLLDEWTKVTKFITAELEERLRRIKADQQQGLWGEA